METVRNGQKVTPTCPECGCRLMVMPTCKHLMHYGINHLTGRDARGCKCSNVTYGGSIYKNQVSFTNAGYNCN